VEKELAADGTVQYRLYVEDLLQVDWYVVICDEVLP
jgi:hypothetical protein